MQIHADIYSISKGHQKLKMNNKIGLRFETIRGRSGLIVVMDGDLAGDVYTNMLTIQRF
jgi:hypothetical protein